jgi:hypothetical protein
MDCEEQIANIFWADAKMIMDYAHFGDVVSFDTTFGTNKESRPFGVFVGFNHFRQTVVFGAALMYDETFASFKWLFEAFLHALKVLDLMNIKSLPPHYVLKRWTREARSGSVQDKDGRNIIENPNMDAMLSYRYMSHKFHNLADRASNFPECVVLVDSTLDILGKQIEEKINACTSVPRYPCTSTDASPPDELLTNARLKKKEVETKSSKRKRSWLDKKHKIRKKREKVCS